MGLGSKYRFAAFGEGFWFDNCLWEKLTLQTPHNLPGLFIPKGDFINNQSTHCLPWTRPSNCARTYESSSSASTRRNSRTRHSIPESTSSTTQDGCLMSMR